MPIPAAFDLSGPVAVVTGAGSLDGIGFAASRLLAELGAAVMISAATARIQDRVRDLRSAGFDAAGVAGDLTDAGAAARLVATADVTAPAAVIPAVNQTVTPVGRRLRACGARVARLEAELAGRKPASR
jgi:NAD(P)-dependent dehydrogenase (short-subunit alcohol dehydrogenase family)